MAEPTTTTGRTADPAPTNPGRPPVTVTITTVVLSVTALIDLIAAVLSVPVYRRLNQQLHSDLLDAGVDPTAANRVASLAINSLLVTIAISAAIGLAVLAMAWLVHRGAPAARILTIVACVGIVLCLGAASLTNSVSIGDPETTQLLNAAYPNWYFPASHTMTAIQVTGYLTAILLLALPASAHHFRPRTDSGWIHSRED